LICLVTESALEKRDQLLSKTDKIAFIMTKLTLYYFSLSIGSYAKVELWNKLSLVHFVKIFVQMANFRPKVVALFQVENVFPRKCNDRH
jgi:hypothetical protein